jgi:hypothetical protein
MKKLGKMREEASKQEEEMEQLVAELEESDGFDKRIPPALVSKCRGK